ncbi:hypothetical protein R3W88_024901 [Solanum pinnatisectum]|uniref:NADH dehydrogenase subunit 5 n=1 Tax=Solanum pinnatisectum TaxID=50273 RepID=A0AAV9M2I4_9SOLN|nr:hypothetical protein R3W88_024901 [Solanum pinnatisectum]
MPLCHCLIFGCLITLEIMYLLIVFLPLLDSFVAGCFGRFLGKEGTTIITTTCVSFSSIFSRKYSGCDAYILLYLYLSFTVA